MAMLSGGFAGKAEEIFGQRACKKEAAPVTNAAASKPAADLVGLMLKAERAQPKPTARNPIYANFGKKAKGPSASRNGPKARAAAASHEQESPASAEVMLTPGAEKRDLQTSDGCTIVFCEV